MKRNVFALIFILVGCKEQAQAPLPPDHAALPVQTGVVAEMVEVENYTYIRLEAEGDEVWIATLPIWVSPGDVVEFSGGAVMKDFHSETLGKTFDTILFVDNLQIPDEQTSRDIVAEAHKKAGAAAARSGAGAEPMAPIAPVGDGRTIADIYAGYPNEEGQSVQLRAQVVKVNSGILGKNWVTLMDGTGTAPNDQIVSTTQQTVAPGELVDVSAVIRQDVSLGYGYDYSLLLEEATFTPVEQNQNAN